MASLTTDWFPIFLNFLLLIWRIHKCQMILSLQSINYKTNMYITGLIDSCCDRQSFYIDNIQNYSNARYLLFNEAYDEQSDFKIFVCKPFVDHLMSSRKPRKNLLPCYLCRFAWELELNNKVICIFDLKSNNGLGLNISYNDVRLYFLWLQHT